MLVENLDRDIRLSIQFPGYANKLPALIASAKLPKTKPNDCIHLLRIIYPEETVQDIQIDSSNKNYDYRCSLLEVNSSAVVFTDFEGIHFCV